jgi:hypothetical protein
MRLSSARLRSYGFWNLPPAEAEAPDISSTMLREDKGRRASSVQMQTLLAQFGKVNEYFPLRIFAL